MTPSLERLSEIVRQAESRTRARKLEGEVRQAAEALRAAEGQARGADEKLREVRPASARRREQADADEHQLKELVKKLAQFRASLETGADAEALIDAARAEIDQTRRDACAALDAANAGADEARKALRPAVDHYGALRRELDRLRPDLAEAFAADDRVAWEAEMYFPGGRLLALTREVEAGAPHFGALPRAEQYAQLKLWIGRYRQFQDEAEPDASADAPATAQRVFLQLKGLSKQYEPGYIEAFRLDFHTDWSAYAAEAQHQLQQATEGARRDRDDEHRPTTPARSPAHPRAAS